MKIGFDLDEVIIDCISAINLTVNEEFNIDIDMYNKTHCYAIENNSYVDDLYINKKLTQRVYELFKDVSFVASLNAYDDVAKVIKTLKRKGHSIHIITSRSKQLIKATVSSLRRNKIHFDSLHHTGDDSNKNTGSKGAYGKILDLDFFIDDNTEHLENMLSYKSKWRKGLLLLDKPWNRKYVDESRFKRIFNITELYRYFGVPNR